MPRSKQQKIKSACQKDFFSGFKKPDSTTRVGLNRNHQHAALLDITLRVHAQIKRNEKNSELFGSNLLVENGKLSTHLIDKN